MSRIAIHNGSMTVMATVRIWHEDAGWGVLDSCETPGGCWTHFSALRGGGYRSAKAGDHVVLEWEPAVQDGFAYRAVSVSQSNVEPSNDDGDSRQSLHAHESTLTIDPIGSAES